MRTIDITTTQNVTIEYELADLKDRFLAFFIDVMIVGAFYFVLFLMLFETWFNLLGDGGFIAPLIGFFVPVALFVLYQLISEMIADGQTWGKKAAGIKVVRLDGEEPGMSDYLLRAMFHLVDTVLSLGTIAAFLISSTGKSQRLGDLTANTIVIKVKFNLRFQLEDILKINSLKDYEPAFPEVRSLSEKDMLLIKSVISRYRKYRNQAHQEVVNQLVRKLMDLLDISETPKNKIEFLQTLLRDYIVLTR